MGTDANCGEAEKQPGFLYRYLDCYGLDAIHNLELKITPPNEFNDPFEFTPRVRNSDVERSAILRRTQKEAQKLGKTPTEAQNIEIGRQLNNGAPEEFKNIASKYFGVLCFSRKSDISTQWAHYSDKHTGLVLELNMNAGCFKRHEVFRVRYCRPEQKAEQNLWTAIEASESGNQEFIEKILQSCGSEKGSEWCLEKEYRLMISMLTHTVRIKMINGRILYFLPTEAAAIERIILGAKAAAEFELKVRKAATRSGIPAERIVRAEIDHRSLSVVIPPTPKKL